MSETGANIIAAVEEFQKLYQQIALLLETADEQMKSHGWEPRARGQAAPGSAALDNPRLWLPSVMFRMYYDKKREHLVSFVSVILCDRDGDAVMPVTEPLVSAGWYDYGTANPNPGHWGWTHSHLLHANRKDDGSIISTTDRKWLGSDTYKVVRFNSLALPLTDIRSSENLRQRIVKPLVDHLNKTVSEKSR